LAPASLKRLEFQLKLRKQQYTNAQNTNEIRKILMHHTTRKSSGRKSYRRERGPNRLTR